MDHIKDDFNIDHINVQNVTEAVRYNLPKDYKQFHTFVRDRGWKLDQDYKLRQMDDKNSVRPEDAEEEIGIFLQAWLFFGLIFTVVQRGGEPILEYKELVNGGYVTTKELNRAIEEWKKWESENLNGIRLRMIRVEKVLDIARRVTRKNCSYNEGEARPAAGNSFYISDPLALSLMVLGETLSAVKARILDQTFSNLKGWHRDDGEGWGQPAYVWAKMRHGDWCPRTIHLWRNQLRSHATLLLASYHAYQGTNRFKGKDHINGHGTDQPKCNENNCFVMPRDDGGSYQSAHAGNCTNQACGEMQGPDMVIVNQLLKTGKIPLLQFAKDPRDSNVIDISVIARTDVTEYATISHVWSDGFGNETENKLYPCQLQFISRQLNNLKSWNYPFWMDTLAVPVDKDLSIIRKIAIGHIFTIFRRSSFTIVLDGGLITLNSGMEDKPGHAAMKILASSWMRRLWTLQEAFLSNQIHFSFAEDHRPDHLREFTDISDKLKSSSGADVTTALLNMVNEHLRYHIIDSERGARRDHLVKREEGGLGEKQAAVLIANVWRAAKWRTTSNSYHETLALATLLNLDYQNTPIGTNGLEQALPEKPSAKDDMRTEKTDGLMIEFWKEFNKRWPNSVPPGIIFLQGEKINRRGFGWAPRTWMSADPVEAPDPLSIMNSTAGLDVEREHGLRVSYPGFLLESKNKRLLLATNKEDQRFWFPTDPSFLDWYVAEPADTTVKLEDLQPIIDDPKPLAIILSRSKPGIAPAEIGLLVQIRNDPNANHEESETDQRERIQLDESDFTDGNDKRAFFCEILYRVKVSRETQTKFHAVNRGCYFEDYDKSYDDLGIPEVMVDSSLDDKICVAEELDSSQVWYVDGYFTEKKQAESPGEPKEVPGEVSGEAQATRPLWFRKLMQFGGSGGVIREPQASLRRERTVVGGPLEPPEEVDPLARSAKTTTWPRWGRKKEAE
ncbi:hypothetical protein GGR51DRAFT_568438 [Nemania sp. FL0031]|nr:hypothetical protein GGR51DRAFT_568438 [Nemania sp. FL0031]